MSSRVRIIINADDFGASREVNNAISELMSQGKITSASILANSPEYKRAVEITKLYPECSFGVHLNLTEHRPLTKDNAFRPILNQEGNFNGNIRNVKISSALRKAIFREWCAQIETVSLDGIEISHVDSHHHIHTIPKLFLILKRIQKKYKIFKVRNTMNIYSNNTRPASYKLICLKKIWIIALKYYYPTKITSGFTSLQVFLESLKYSSQSHRNVELMVHPGHPGYAEETALLHGSWMKQLPFDVELINYKSL